MCRMLLVDESANDGLSFVQAAKTAALGAGDQIQERDTAVLAAQKSGVKIIMDRRPNATLRRAHVPDTF